MSKDGDTSSGRSFFEFLRHHKPSVSEEEIKGLVVANEALDEEEKRMISDLLDLGSMTVREIMKPRVDMIMAEDTESGQAALLRMRGTGYSRLPVFHEDIDNVIGIVYYKDLVSPLMEGRIDEPVSTFMFDPLFVPETKNALALLSELQAEHQQMAIVVDEYGGTDGLITMEDIVEEIVGEIADESDLDRDLITLLDVNSWRVDGRFPVEDALELGWPLVDSDDYETIAGWLIDTFDFVPKVGDEFDVDGYSFKVEKMRRSRISAIRVKKLERPAKEPSNP